jgi:hypothetical protein
MIRHLGLAILLNLGWSGPGLAQAANCNAGAEARRASLEEAVRLCSGAAHDALTCYDGARRFIRDKEALLAHQDVLKCTDADVAALRSELIWARGLVNKKASEARRIFLEQTLIDRLFVVSVKTLKAYVCMTLVNDAAKKDEKILPENRENVLVEETLPITLANRQQEIRFKNKRSGSVCGFIQLPGESALGEFEERLFLAAKGRIAEAGKEIAAEFPLGGGTAKQIGEQQSNRFLSIVGEYQAAFADELKKHERGIDVIGLLAKRAAAKEVTFIEAHGPEVAVLGSDNAQARETYDRFVQWLEKTVLK